MRVPSSCSKHNTTGLSRFHSQDVHLWCPTGGQKPGGRRGQEGREGTGENCLVSGAPPQALLTSWAQHRPQTQGPGISKPSLRGHGKKSAPLLQTRPSTPSALMRHLRSLRLLPRAHLSGNATSSGSTRGGGIQESRGMD